MFYLLNRNYIVVNRLAACDKGDMTDLRTDIMATREFTRRELISRGFIVTDSKANFLFVRSSRISGGELVKMADFKQKIGVK